MHNLVNKCSAERGKMVKEDLLSHHVIIINIKITHASNMKIAYHVPLASLSTLCTLPHLIFITTYEIRDIIFMYRWGNWSSERLRTVQDHTISKYQSWDLNPHILASQSKPKGSKVWSRSWRTDKISLNEEETEGESMRKIKRWEN